MATQKVIFESNNIFRIVPPSTARPKLAPGVYLLDAGQTGFYLTKKEDFVLPKLYGNHDITKRWLKSFHSLPGNLGILLSGLKGTGKTLEAKKFCIECGLPIIIVNAAFHGPEFIDFLTEQVLGEFVLFIDEFEKVYPEDKQAALLSLMDGAYRTRIIFLFTVNRTNINENMNNRLGRIKYRKNYEQLEDELIQEVIDDLLENKEHADSVFTFIDMSGFITYDILVKLIEEMNLFNEDALTCGAHLNISVSPILYDIQEEWDGVLHYITSKSLIISPDMSKEVFSQERWSRLKYWSSLKKLIPAKKRVKDTEWVDTTDEDEDSDHLAYNINYIQFGWDKATITRNGRGYIVEAKNQYGVGESVRIHFTPVTHKNLFSSPLKSMAY